MSHPQNLDLTGLISRPATPEPQEVQQQPPPPQQHQQYMPPPPQHQQPMQQYMPTPPQYHFARLPPQTPINQAQTPMPQHQYLSPTPQHRLAPPQQTPPLQVAQQDRRKMNPNVFEAEQRQHQAAQFRAEQQALRAHAEHRVPYQLVHPDRAQEMARNQEIAHRRHQDAMMRAQPVQPRQQFDNRTPFQRHQNHQVPGQIPVIFAPQLESQRAQKRPTALDHNQQAKRDRQVPPQPPALQLVPMAHPMQYEPTQGPAIQSYGHHNHQALIQQNRDLQHRNENLQNQNNELQSQLDASRADVTRLEGQVKSQQEALKKMGEDIDRSVIKVREDALKTRNTLTTQINQLTQEKLDLARQLEEAKKQAISPPRPPSTPALKQVDSSASTRPPSVVMVVPQPGSVRRPSTEEDLQTLMGMKASELTAWWDRNHAPQPEVAEHMPVLVDWSQPSTSSHHYGNRQNAFCFPSTSGPYTIPHQPSTSSATHQARQPIQAAKKPRPAPMKNIRMDEVKQEPLDVQEAQQEPAVQQVPVIRKLNPTELRDQADNKHDFEAVFKNLKKEQPEYIEIDDGAPMGQRKASFAEVKKAWSRFYDAEGNWIKRRYYEKYAVHMIDLKLKEFFFNPSFGLACHDVRAIHRAAGHFYGAMQGKGSKHTKFGSLPEEVQREWATIMKFLQELQVEQSMNNLIVVKKNLKNVPQYPVITID